MTLHDYNDNFETIKCKTQTVLLWMKGTRTKRISHHQFLCLNQTVMQQMNGQIVEPTINDRSNIDDHGVILICITTDCHSTWQYWRWFTSTYYRSEVCTDQQMRSDQSWLECPQQHDGGSGVNLCCHWKHDSWSRHELTILFCRLTRVNVADPAFHNYHTSDSFA